MSSIFALALIALHLQLIWFLRALLLFLWWKAFSPSPGLRAVCSSREAIERDDSPRGECGQGCCRWRDDLGSTASGTSRRCGRKWPSNAEEKLDKFFSKKGSVLGSPSTKFKNCQLHFPCVQSRESAAAMTCTQTKPDSMLPRYYVASCTVNLE